MDNQVLTVNWGFSGPIECISNALLDKNKFKEKTKNFGETNWHFPRECQDLEVSREWQRKGPSCWALYGV